MMKMTLAFAAVMMATVSYGQKKEEPKKALVLYYSQTTNTKKVAQEIASRLGADLEEVVAVKPYDGDFQATINRSMKERQEGVTPDIKPLKANLSKYDVIFLGYPIWFGTYAPPVITLLNQIDLAGKKVVPFCTFGSGGLEAGWLRCTCRSSRCYAQGGGAVPDCQWISQGNIHATQGLWHTAACQRRTVGYLRCCRRRLSYDKRQSQDRCLTSYPWRHGIPLLR